MFALTQKSLGRLVQEEKQQKLCELGTIIEARRKELGITPAKLAKDAKVRKIYLRNLERGHAFPKRGSIFMIVSFLNVSRATREKIQVILKFVCAPRAEQRSHVCAGPSLRKSFVNGQHATRRAA